MLKRPDFGVKRVVKSGLILMRHHVRLHLHVRHHLHVLLHSAHLLLEGLYERWLIHRDAMLALKLI